MFSASARSNRSQSSAGRTIAGIVSRPASWWRAVAARQRPARRRHRQAGGRRPAASTPRTRIDSASSASRASSNVRRGCRGLGWISSTGISRRPCSCSVLRGRIAARPRPMPRGRGSAARRMQFGLRHGRPPPSRAADMRPSPRCAGACRVTGHAEARRLPHAHVARDDGLEDELGEVLADLPFNITGKPRAAVVHRQDHSPDRQPRVQLARISESVSSSCASPSSAKYSVCTGTITLSAATSALTVIGPSEGGQSSSVSR